MGSGRYKCPCHEKHLPYNVLLTATKALLMVTFLLSENILKNCPVINMVGMGDWGDIMKNKFCLLHGPLC